MRRPIRLAFSILLLLATSTAWAENPKISMQTSQGTITLELDAEKAPKTVENFLAYVDEGFYNGTIFHRVIEGFMIQGGGFTEDMEKKPTRDPIPNEADNGLKNEKGTIAMARTADPNSATAQFFINHEDNEFLDHTGKNRRGWGYAVFGRVTDGMDVVNAIATLPTGAKGPFPKDVPETSVVIEKVERITD
jgi:cyclophilin family peptidyl-prolyl cis-trans isomerase